MNNENTGHVMQKDLALEVVAAWKTSINVYQNDSEVFYYVATTIINNMLSYYRNGKKTESMTIDAEFVEDLAKRENISYTTVAAALAYMLNGWFIILYPDEDPVFYQSVLKEVNFQENGEIGIHFSGSILEALSIWSEAQEYSE